MIFYELTQKYISVNKKNFWSYIIICSISYILKVIVTPIIYSKIVDVSINNFSIILKEIATLWVILGVFYIIKMRLENSIFPEFLSFIRQELFKNFLDKNKTDFNDSNVSADITRIFEVTRYMRDIFVWFIQSIIPVIILTLIINVYFFNKCKMLGGINLLSNASMLSFIFYKSPSLIEASNQRETEYMNMVQKLDEKYNNLFNIYLNNQIENTITNNKKIEDNYTVVYKKSNKKVENFTTVLKSINYIFAFISIMTLYKNMNDSNRKDFINILLIFTFYISTFENISEDIPNYMMIMGNLKNSEKFLEYKNETKNETKN